MNKDIKIGDTLYGIIWLTREIAAVNPEKIITIKENTIETEDDYYRMNDLNSERIFTNEKDAQAEADRLNLLMQLPYSQSNYE